MNIESEESMHREIITKLQKALEMEELEELDPRSCYDAYNSETIIKDRRNVLLITDKSYQRVNSHSAVLAAHEHRFQPGILDPGDSIWKDSNQAYIDSWTSVPITQCYSERVDEKCKVNMIPAFLIVVIVCNIIKSGACLLALVITRAHPPLVTTGDAIQSFLEEPDKFTKGRCLASKKSYDNFQSCILPGRSQVWSSRLLNNGGDIWNGGRASWLRAPSTWQYIIIIALWLAMLGIGALGATIIAFGGSGNIPTTDLGVSWSSFASPNSEGFNLPGKSRILAFFLVVNLPQLGVSYIYLGLNNIMSTMLAMHEWCGYSPASQKPAKSLRVSSPIPNTEQRASYFLSIPYKWAIPSSVIITAIHWFVSEVLNIIQIDTYGIGVNNSTSSQITTANCLFFGLKPFYSALGLGCGGIIVFLLVFSFMKYPTAIPMAGCCSASIAAACQPCSIGGEDPDPNIEFPLGLARRKLKWVVVKKPEETRSGIGHATFSADDVATLKEGQKYA